MLPDSPALLLGPSALPLLIAVGHRLALVGIGCRHIRVSNPARSRHSVGLNEGLSRLAHDLSSLPIGGIVQLEQGTNVSSRKSKAHLLPCGA